MKNKILIACSKNWFIENKFVKKFLKQNKRKFLVISKKKDLNLTNLNKIKPKIIFFPHWSYIVSKKIINKYRCICFHTAPLPYGRGGSPIQNLILKKIKKTPVCALKMTEKIDSGPIYLKETINLSGNLDLIFEKISFVILKMIKKLIKKSINPKKQRGMPHTFKRIKESVSQIKKIDNIESFYDRIRMVDAKDYPRSYIKIQNFKITFSNSKIKKNQIFCDACISKDI